MHEAALLREGQTIVPRVWITDTVRERMKGLLGRDSLDRDEAMLLAPCRCIHTVFMRFPIDAVFVSRSLAIVRVVRDIAPGRIVDGKSGAWGVVEMASGRSADLQIEIGDVFTLCDSS